MSMGTPEFRKGNGDSVDGFVTSNRSGLDYRINETRRSGPVASTVFEGIVSWMILLTIVLEKR